MLRPWHDLADTGGDDKKAKKLAKQMRQDMQRAKTSLGMNSDDEWDAKQLRRACECWLLKFIFLFLLHYSKLNVTYLNFKVVLEGWG